MDTASSTDPLETLLAYAAGTLGTRASLERLGLRDYADLLIALGQHDLGLPRPSSSPARDVDLRRASAISAMTAMRSV